MKYADVAVVGGGASGLTAALSAAKHFRRANSEKKVLLLEGNNRVGKKILATGNGRCNLSNEALSDASYYGDKERVARILFTCTAAQVEEMFADIGLLCRSDKQGRIYPNNLQAAAVLKVLRAACEETGVDCRCDSEIFSVSRQNHGFLLKAANGNEFFAGKLILCCGGKASPKHSCTQNGYVLAEQLGHSITALHPALVQISCLEKLTKTLKGLRSKAEASLYVDGRIAAKEQGEVIFADGALSGICIFDLSAKLADLLQKGLVKQPLQQHAELVLDLVPHMTADTLVAYLQRIQANMPHIAVKDMLSGVVNIRVGESILKQQVSDCLRPVELLNIRQLSEIAGAVKGLTFHVTGLGGWEQAQVTLGGVPLEECHTKTMESRRCGGLYIAGEMLKPAGKCGGYNLHFAWATGMIAGKSAAENIIYV